MKDLSEIFRSLIRLRESLGIPLGKKEYESVALNPIERVRIELESGDIDVSLDDIEKVAGGALLGYKENLVIFYISDTGEDESYLMDDKLIRPNKNGKEQTKHPKFHFSWCQTLQQMKDMGRGDRYRSTRKGDGLFRVFARNDRDEAYELNQRVKLFVCQNCLDETEYKGFSKFLKPKRLNHEFVESFSIKDFLEENDGTFRTIMYHTKYTDETDVANNYPKNFSTISARARDRANWICSECHVDMSGMKGGLHVHHRNGEKTDNSRSNLKVLCALCHQDIHKSMYVRPEYERYIRKHRPHQPEDDED